MKAKILIALGIAACLCFGACSENQHPEIDGESSSVSSSILESQDGKDSTYTIENAPFFDVTFDNIGKIYAYDAGLGEEWTVVDPENIDLITKKMREISFYNETPSVDPVVESLSHQCFDYFEFYKEKEDTTPIFSMGLEPFYIEVRGEKIGPYTTVLPDGYITELLKLFLDS